MNLTLLAIIPFYIKPFLHVKCISKMGDHCLITYYSLGVHAANVFIHFLSQPVRVRTDYNGRWQEAPIWQLDIWE